MTFRQKLLYHTLWCLAWPIMIVGCISMLITEGCSNACDAIDEKRDSIEDAANNPT